MMSDREDDDGGDDVPQLSAAALAALQEFYAESEAGHAALRHSYTVGAMKEDWVSGGSLQLLTCSAVQQCHRQSRRHSILQANNK